MDWTELLIEIAVLDIETASNIMTMAAPYGFYVEDYSDLEEGAREIAHIDLIDETLLAKDRSKAVIHMYISPEENPNETISYLKEAFLREQIDCRVTSNLVHEEDWANNWKQYFKPMEIGDKLLILPGWETVPKTDRKILKIDPGAAFGTGTHATTKLCIETLEQVIKPGSEVLDIGCGSGILSIAARLLGAKKVTGIDIDALAVKTARQNGADNGFLEPDYHMVAGDLTENIAERFDICVANIVADVIIRLCENISGFLKPGGRFLMSGIIDTREDEVVAAVRKAGLTIISRRESGGWVCLLAE